MALMYPDRCIFCGEIVQDGILICSKCAKNISTIGKDICDLCGKERKYCTCKVGDFAFVRNIAYFYYDGAVKELVKRFKFRNVPQLSVIMSKYMTKSVADKYSDFTFDFVTYVPSSRIKMSQRGYNPAELLAKNLSKNLELPLRDTLKSKFKLKPQKYTNFELRKKQVKGKYILKDADVAGKRVLLVDDVMTSGATLSECAKILKKGGAKSVFCVTFAITLKK